MQSNFAPMLAKDGKDLDRLEFPQVVQLKLDGIRCTIVNGEAKSRTLKDIPNDEIRQYLSRRYFDGLDGEIVVGDPNDPNAMQKTTSYVMSKDKTGEDWKFYVFDTLMDSDDDPIHGAPFSDRYEELASRLLSMDDMGNFTPDNQGRIELVDGVLVYNVAIIEAIEAKALADGYEGVILRDPRAPYKYGRSGVKGPLLKLKRFEDGEAMIIGWVEEMHNANEAKKDALGHTERSSHKENKIGKGTLGAYIVTDRVTGVEFQVGTGFTAAQRKKFWEERGDHMLNGTYIKYKSFPTGVKDKPRHPVFLGFRDLEIDG